MDAQDYQLLQEFVRGSPAKGRPSAQAEAAFSALALRYVDLVYSAAVRQTGDVHDAADVTQAAFIALVRKAPQIAPGVILAGWLLNAVRFAAAELRRGERRLKSRERKVAMAREIETQSHASTDTAGIDDFLPLLDEALAGLGEGYRAALLLRYFEGKDYAQTAAALGVTEPAARQRVSRAVDKLRALFARRGVQVTVGAVATGLSRHASHAATPDLVASVCAAPGLAAAGGGAAELAGAADWAMRAGEVKTAAATLGLVLASLLACGWMLSRWMTPIAPAAPRGVANVVAARPAPAAAQGPVLPVVSSGARYTSPRPTVGTGERAIDLPAGAVLGPDGAPVEGAQVYLVDSQRMLWVYWRQYFGGLAQVSGPGGSFSFPPQEYEPWQVVVCHESGFARLAGDEVKAGGRVALRPWARIEGTLRDSSGPLAGQRVRLSLPRVAPLRVRGQIGQDMSVLTDGQGKFVFSQVVPGEIWLAREFEAPIGGHTFPTRVMVTAGETASVDIAPRGAVVTGRIKVAPEAAAGHDGWAAGDKLWSVGRVSRVGGGESIALPPVPADAKPDAQDAVYEAWEQTEPVRQLKMAGMSQAFVIALDGTFRIEGLAPGQYVFSVRSEEREEPTGASDTIGRATMVVTVPEGAIEVVAGTMVWQPTECLRIGKPAPAIKGIGPDGKLAAMLDYRGDYVIGVSSSGGQPLSPAEQGALKELVRKYPSGRSAAKAKGTTQTSATLQATTAPTASNAPSASALPPGLVVLELNSDPSGLEIDRITTFRELSRPTTPRPMEVPADHGGSIRSGEAFLIGPDGLVIAKHLRGRKLVDMVAGVMRGLQEGGRRAP